MVGWYLMVYHPHMGYLMPNSVYIYVCVCVCGGVYSVKVTIVENGHGSLVSIPG